MVFASNNHIWNYFLNEIGEIKRKKEREKLFKDKRYAGQKLLSRPEISEIRKYSAIAEYSAREWEKRREKSAPDQTNWSEENTERVKNLSWKENIATSKILQ